MQYVEQVRSDLLVIASMMFDAVHWVDHPNALFKLKDRDKNNEIAGVVLSICCVTFQHST